MVDFDQLTQYVYTAEDGTLVVADLPPSEPMPEPESTGEPLTPYTPPPSLDERVVKVEAEVATTQEVLDVLLGGV